MEDEKEDIWKASKIVEEDENGELRLLHDNLDKLQRHLHLNECDVADLNIISVIGAHENENAFLTNLLPVYLKKTGKSSWSSSLSKEGLGGFAFGTIVDNKEEEIASCENSNEENFLQRADCDNQLHSSDEKKPTKLDLENKEKALEDVCESMSVINLENDHPPNLNPEDENNHTQESPALENSKGGFSGMNLQQRIEIYKIVSKLILHAGILPQTCRDDVSKATAALFSAAEMFERIVITSKDDMDSGDEDFEIVNSANTLSLKIEDFVACSETLMKESERILSEPCMKQPEADRRMDGTNEIKIDQVDNKNGLVERDTGSELVKSNNSQEKGNNGPPESYHSIEKDNNGKQGDNSPEKDNNGPPESDNSSAIDTNRPPESDHSPEKDNNGPSESDNSPAKDNNGPQKSENSPGQDNSDQKVPNNFHGSSNEQLENANLNEKGKTGQFTINNLQENDDEQVKNNTSENANNGQLDSSTGLEKLNISHVNGSSEPQTVSIGQKDITNKQTESYPKQNDVTIDQSDINANQPPEVEDVNEMCVHQEDPANEKKQSMISSKLFQPDESKSAIYVYPEIIPPENDPRKIKWCILHLHKKSNNILAEDGLKLEQFLLAVCTKLVWISDKETTTTSASDQYTVALINDPSRDPNLLQKLSNIGIENQEKSTSKITTVINVPKETFRIAHDGSGILTLSRKHSTALSSLLEKITEFQIAPIEKAANKASHFKATNFEQYINSKFKNFNLPSGLMGKMRSEKDKKSVQKATSSMTQDQGNTIPPLQDSSKARDDENGEASVTDKLEALKLSKAPPELELEDKILEETTSKYVKSFEHKLAEWIENELDMGNVRKILSLYQTWLVGITKKISKSRGLEKDNIHKIEEKMKQRTNEKCKPIIDEVIKGLENFCAYFCAHYEKNLCYQTQEIEIFLEDQRTKMLKNLKTEEAVKLMRVAHDKLAAILRKYNKKRMDAGKNISMETKHKIRQIYSKKLELKLSSKIPIDPEILGQFHNALTSNLLAAYEKCIDNNIALAEDKEHLRHNLLADFQDFFDRNMLLLELSQKKVKGFIGKSKSGYEEIMDNLLKKNKCGINPEEFEKTHLEESSKAENILKRGIQTDEELCEPIEKHLVTLKKHIEKSYKTFKEDNEEFLEKSEKLGKGTEADSSKKGSKISQQKTSRELPNDSENPEIKDQSSQEPALKKIKRELPPLLLQIALGKIGMATLPQKSWESNSVSINITSYPGEVGILMDGKWVCGDDVKEFSRKRMLKEFWSFEAIFNTHDFKDSVVIDGDKIDITAPFLLGVFFKILKQKAETEHSGTISMALISVPFWFSAYKRIQIVEAGTIAGFDRVELVNENTASAYYAYTNALSPPHENIVVISENSSRVDISIYSYNQYSKTISMEGQSGDYETAELSKDKNFFHQFVTGIFVYLFNNQKETGIEEKALKSLDKLWELAKSRRKIPMKLNDKTVLICCESDHWREFLYKFASKITKSEKILVRNDSPFLGLASFLHACVEKQNGSVHSLFKDSIPFDVIRSQGKEASIVLKKKNIFSSLANQKYWFEVPKSVGIFNIEENDLSPQRLGKLNLKSKPPYSFNIHGCLQRSRNGILKLTAVEYTEGGPYAMSKALPDCYFEWIPCKTNNETLGLYKSLMDQIKLQTNVSSVVEQTNKQTEEMANKIKEVIQAGGGKFKSSLGKNMVIKQIDDLLGAIKDEGIQEKSLKKHVTYLESIAQKYELQL